jgi:SP family sugar:H+ symporter-like MFS transporter
LIAANLYVFCFGFSWVPVVWVLLGEMFNNMIRGSALALSAAVQWIANFIVSTTFPPIAFNLGLGIAYGLYAAFAALSFVFVVAFIKETKGKKLEEMDGERAARPEHS